MTGNCYAKYWTATSFFPYWQGIYPDEVLSSEWKAQKVRARLCPSVFELIRPLQAFAGLGYLTGARYNGTLPHSLLQTGFQWDGESSWPPFPWIAAKAVEGLPSNVTKSSFQSFGAKVSNFSFIPPGHFGLKNEEDLPQQPRLDGSSNFTSAIVPFGTVGNMGNYSVTKDKSWKQGLTIAIANRYTAAAFCSWYATAGSIPGLLGRVSSLQFVVVARTKLRLRSFRTTSSTRLKPSTTPTGTCLRSSTLWILMPVRVAFLRCTETKAHRRKTRSRRRRRVHCPNWVRCVSSAPFPSSAALADSFTSTRLDERRGAFVRSKLRTVHPDPRLPRPRISTAFQQLFVADDDG